MSRMSLDPKDPERIAAMARDPRLTDLSLEFLRRSAEHRYSYNFTWLGRPIIQYPTDIVAMQEIIWSVRPDFILETGIAHGGSLVLYASMLELIGDDGVVVGVDIEIRPHNRLAIEQHPMSKRIQMIEGSSVDGTVAARVAEMARGRKRVLVTLDSNHTHEHVLQELRLYSPLVRSGSYLVVFDTSVDDMPAGSFPDRPWGAGNNPKTAVRHFLRENDRFAIDREIEQKLLITVAPEGYLRCIKDPQ